MKRHPNQYPGLPFYQRRTYFTTSPWSLLCLRHRTGPVDTAADFTTTARRSSPIVVSYVNADIGGILKVQRLGKHFLSLFSSKPLHVFVTSTYMAEFLIASVIVSEHKARLSKTYDYYAIPQRGIGRSWIHVVVLAFTDAVMAGPSRRWLQQWCLMMIEETQVEDNSMVRHGERQWRWRSRFNGILTPKVDHIQNGIRPATWPNVLATLAYLWKPGWERLSIGKSSSKETMLKWLASQLLTNNGLQ